ncbi:MAG: hypothetical protein IPM24_10510 [Bryobacterales bacterium]|nr:hypothetical protein [Bryobacterales bacterium]
MSSALSGLPAKKAAEDASKEAKAAQKKLQSLNAAQAIDNYVAEEIRKVPSADEAGKLLTSVEKRLVEESGKLKKDRETIGKLKALAEDLKTLKDDFSTKPEILETLRQQILDRGDQIDALERTYKEQSEKATRLDKEVKEYIDSKILNKAQVTSWEKDRTTDPARSIETDLGKMRQALEQFPNKPVDPLQDCAYKRLKTHLEKAETELDQIAHKAPCHKCKKENGVQRTPDAKDLVKKKVARLEELAKLDNDNNLGEPEKADWVLAKALDRMRTTKDETGKTAGKMLGALVCKNAKDELVVLWAYSGEIADGWREANATVSRLQKALQEEKDLPKRGELEKLLKEAETLRDHAGKEDALKEELVRKYWSHAIPQTGPDAVLRSAAGGIESIEKLNHGNKKTPHGVCAAPKMIQQAHQKGLVPIGMAEAWFGGGDNAHGEFVASCETCMKNVGFQLCRECK